MTYNPAQDNVISSILAERDRQDGLWGQQNHSPLVWLAILSEEVGEVSKEVNEGYFRGKSTAAYREELVQVAAVAMAAIESLDRNTQ